MLLDRGFAAAFFAAGSGAGAKASATWGCSFTLRSRRVRSRLVVPTLKPLPMSRTVFKATTASAGRPWTSQIWASARCVCGQVGANLTAFSMSLSASAGFDFKFSFARRRSKLQSSMGSAAALALSSPPIDSNAFSSCSARFAGSSSRLIFHFCLDNFLTLPGTSSSASSVSIATAFLKEVRSSTMEVWPLFCTNSALGPRPQRPRQPQSSTLQCPLTSSSISLSSGAAPAEEQAEPWHTRIDFTIAAWCLQRPHRGLGLPR
mmetsp:Transcript_121807/g.389491  ORF Transcript_121807/g.389491 Transcript_121807/m.389491 type:complete len:262 (+) Transcript_121807:1264-2049(+)